MKYKEQLGNLGWILLFFSLPLGIGYVIGWNDGKTYERDAILERLEEIKELHRQDSIKQQRNNKAMKQKIQITGKNIGDLFKLPCVTGIGKRNIGKEGDFVVVINYEDNPAYERMQREIERMWNDPKVNESQWEAYDNKMNELFPTGAYPGDWLVEDEKGNWHVEKGGEK
jgi:hypothetical protein|nr:MAG TPA: hypothetical protein [Caudoviricetes sp.]